MTSGPAQLPRIRAQVGSALAEFLDRQRCVLAGIDDRLLPCLDAIGEFLAGGKRLRPAFCYWGWRAAGGPEADADGRPILTAAAALELLQASALVHDDVMDASDTRRGRPSLHRSFAAAHQRSGWRGSAAAFGAGAAILIGDLLLAWTDEMFHRSGLPQDALSRGRPVLDTMRTEVFCGQYLDLAGQAAASTSVRAALRVVVYKSAKYTIERPLQLGAALAGQDGEAGALAAAFTGYGIPLGIAFQLRDDILGVFGDPGQTGKPVSDDVREGKRTVLIAMARERATAAQAEIIERHLGNPLLSAGAAAEVRGVITDSGALAECEQMIERKVGEALAALHGAPVTAQARAALAELAVAATARLD
jgi:geranylgeranyl diphosphate synthase, type I